MKRSIMLLAFAASAFLFAESASSFSTSVVHRHNALRAKHGAAPLSYSPAVAKVAQEWADKIAREDKMRHRQPNKYGENIYWISGGSPTGESVTDSWYNEIKDYNFARR